MRGFVPHQVTEIETRDRGRQIERKMEHAWILERYEPCNQDSKLPACSLQPADTSRLPAEKTGAMRVHRCTGNATLLYRASNQRERRERRRSSDTKQFQTRSHRAREDDLHRHHLTYCSLYYPDEIGITNRPRCEYVAQNCTPACATIFDRRQMFLLASPTYGYFLNIDYSTKLLWERSDTFPVTFRRQLKGRNTTLKTGERKVSSGETRLPPLL